MSDDLISRQAAIEYLMTNMCWYIEDGYESDDDYKRECITDLINGVPSAQPRNGKWIGYKADDKDWQRDDGSPIFMNCSECHESVINNGSAHWNFCPNCGADMRERKEE